MEFFLFLDGFWLAGFVVWKGKQEEVLLQKCRDLRKQMGGQGKSLGQEMDGTQTGVDRAGISRHQLTEIYRRVLDLLNQAEEHNFAPAYVLGLHKISESTGNCNKPSFCHLK